MTDTSPSHEAESADQPKPMRSLSSTEIFQGERAIEIVHQGERYRLLVTKNNKLILQK